MIDNKSNIEYYNRNVLRAITNWNILSNATIINDKIKIGSSGVAGYDLQNTYNNGLKASKYRSLSISLELSINQQYNYENYIEVVLKGTYKDSDENINKSYQSINITYLNSSLSDNILTMNRVIQMPNYDYDELTIYVINHTSSNIILNNCIMKRSQDINSSQIGESIGWGIALSKVIGYLDGCEVYYDGVEEPTKMWWQEDEEGNFSGINVDNERLILFERKNEILLD